MCVCMCMLGCSFFRKKRNVTKPFWIFVSEVCTMFGIKNKKICWHSNTLLVLFTSALSPQNLWVWFSQPHGTAICFPPSTVPTQKMSSSLNSQTLYWFRSQLPPQHLWVLLPSAPWPNNMWVLLPSTLNTQNVSSSSIPKHCIGFDSLSFVTTKIYGFHFPQPHGPTICEFPFPQH